MTHYDLCSARGTIRSKHYFLSERVIEDIKGLEGLESKELKYVGSLFIGSSTGEMLWECNECHYCIATARMNAQHVLDHAVRIHKMYICDRLKSGQIELC
jgi:hypothetical protein